MDSMELNKIVGAVLVAGIAYNLMGFIADKTVHPTHLEKTAIKIEGVAAPTQAAPEAPAPLPPIAPLMAKADPAAGAADVKKLCAVCHNFVEGAGAKVGPDLYGVVMRDRASAPGFEYSDALKSKPGKWTYDDLNAWLSHPAAFAHGTKMAFIGIDDPKERADVIDYLHTLAATPVPLPK